MKGFHLLLMTLCVGRLQAQAPGDEDDRCQKSPYVHTYEDNVNVLMDSYNYLQLLPGNGTGNPPIASALWNDMSFDGNDMISTTAATYWQQSAGTCQFQIKVCGFRQPGATQDNWLFTQYISKSFDANTNNYPDDVEILVDITYALQSCRSNRNPSCNTQFKLYHYITNDTQLPSTNGSGFMNKANYASFGTVSPAATGARYTETHHFTLNYNETGFYIAIEDTGTCVIVSRLLVYRHNCKSMQIGLVSYPETPAPVSGSTVINITCVDYANISGSPEVTCGSDGLWGPENPRCECSEGHEPNSEVYSISCDPCPPGYFKSKNVMICTPCPPHSDSTTPAASMCPCDESYFRLYDNTGNPHRSDIENELDGCTISPSKPRNLNVAETRNTSIAVTWEQPDVDGERSDLFYRVLVEEIGTLDGLVEQDRLVFDATSLQYTLIDLRPVTEYRVAVQTENGVSYQDSIKSRLEERRTETIVKTREGIPEQVLNPRPVDNIVLVWGPPTVPNGVITGYEVGLVFCPTDLVDGSGADENAPLSPDPETADALKYSNCASIASEDAANDTCQSYRCQVESDTLFFVLRESIVPEYNTTLNFTIRGKTAQGGGVWSDAITIVPYAAPDEPTCPPQPDPTSCSPAATSTVTVVVSSPRPSSTESAAAGLDDCIVYMGGAAGAIFVVTTLVMCLFSCIIACLCHKHKMKTFKINMKKQMHSKWEY